MTAPQWGLLGNTANGQGAASIAWPAGHAAGDLGILFIETANEAVPDLSAQGWTQASCSPQGTGTAGGTSATRLTLYWKRATSGSEANVTFADVGNHFYGRIHTVTGAKSSGDPVNLCVGNTAGSSTSVTFPGGATTVDEALVLHYIAWSFDGSAQANDDGVNADLTGLTARSDIGTTQGNGGGVAIWSGEKTTAGSFGSTTASLINASVQGRITLAIEPEPPVTDRRAQVYFAEMEVPTAPRRGQVYFAELEVPNAPRRAIVYFAEMEAPDAPADRRARIYFAEMEAPDAPRRARVYFAELETPDAPRRARVYFAELEVPTAPRRARIYFAELEVPEAPTNDRRARIYFAEMETPYAPAAEAEESQRRVAGGGRKRLKQLKQVYVPPKKSPAEEEAEIADRILARQEQELPVPAKRAKKAKNITLTVFPPDELAEIQPEDDSEILAVVVALMRAGAI